MKQSYLNCPSTGGAIPAEEYAAALGAAAWPGSGCGQNSCNCAQNGWNCGQNGCNCGQDQGSGCPCPCCGQDQGSGCPCFGQGNCPCGPQMVCCCQPVMPPQTPPAVEEGCCCKQSFRAALGLLCDQQISSVLNFDTAAFITDTYSVGATITPITPPAAGAPVPPADNLGAALTGSFRRFAPCSCDLLDVDGAISTGAGAAVGLTASQVSLCQLGAVAIQAADAAAEGDLSAEEVTARNFRCLRQRLSQRLNPCGDGCGQSCCSCASDGRDCCCAAGLLGTLAQNNLSRRVSLVAGLLALQNVTLVGAAGNVLVLSNDEDNRLYFVCVNSVQFIA